MTGVGFAAGFRSPHGASGLLAALGLVVASGYAISWGFASLGLRVSDPEAAQAAAVPAVFLLVFTSAAFVPATAMPGWLQAFGTHQPVNALVNAERALIEDTWGPVGILVANAGGSFTPPAPLERIPEDGWRATVDGNLLATFLTLKSFLPGMKERRRGTIITIGSAAGRRAHPRSPIPYAAAKAGIALLTQDVAAQAGPFGIRVNCITPETILTEGNQEQIPAELQASLADAHPLKRLGTPQDVATAAAFLVSGEAAWITGVVIDVAGGAVLV